MFKDKKKVTFCLPCHKKIKNLWISFIKKLNDFKNDTCKFNGI